MKCPQCQHENREGAKFCLECGAELEHMCPQCGAKLPPGARFCDECGTKLMAVPPTAPPKLEDMQKQLQDRIPQSLADKLFAGARQMQGEYRLVTAIFADVVGSSGMARNIPLESYVETMNDCFKMMVDTISIKYEGSINRFIGDCVLAFFGAPITHENDAERAILAALDIREGVKELGLHISIGINTGMTYVGEMGSDLTYSERSAWGPDVDFAKRLQEAAGPGEIWVGASTYRLTRRAFDFGERRDIEAKGARGTAYPVLRAKERPEKLRGIEGLRARMVGREHEFDQLREAAEAWLLGQGQMVSIIGEAGIGKSRLVAELRAYLDSKLKTQDRSEEKEQSSESTSLPRSPFSSPYVPLSLLEGRCMSIGQPISYWPFLDILHSWFGLSEDDSEAEIAQKVRENISALLPDRYDDTLPFLGHLMNIRFGDDLDTRLEHYSPEQISYQTMMRLRELLVSLSHEKPLLLVLEDLHWADDLSLDLVSLLMDELMEHPLMLVCVYRPEQKHRVWRLGSQAQRKCLERYTEIELQKLLPSASRRLVQELLAIDNLPEKVRSIILDKSEGNPFFIEEVIRSLIERGLVYQENELWKAREDIVELEVPDTIQSVVLARVDRLEAEARYVLQCASVIGRLFKHRLLEHLTQKQRELDGYIDEFEERDLIYEERSIPELEYAFKHALTQEATYQGILEQRRRSFHRQVALGIEKLYQERIEDFYEELAHHWERSGDKEKTLEYLVKAGQKAARRYLNEAAVDYYTRAVELAKELVVPGDKLAEIYEYRGSLYSNMTFYEESVSDMKRAANLYTDRVRRARMYSGISNTSQFQIADVEEAVRYAHKAIEEVTPDDKSRESSLLYQAAGPVFVYSIDLKEGERLLRKAASISEEMDYKDLLAMQYTLIGWMYWFFPRTEEYAKLRRSAWEKAHAYLPYSKSDLGSYATACGLLSGASSSVMNKDGESLALEALEAGIKSGNAWIAVIMTSFLGFVYRNRGDIDKAIQVCERGWREGIRVRYIFGPFMIGFAKELMRLYTLRGEEQKLLDMVLQMIDSTLILHGKPEVHPIVQFRWNNTVDDIYRNLRSLNQDVFHTLEESLRSRFSDADSDSERFFYQGQLARLSLLDERRTDAVEHLHEMARLHPDAERFAHRIPKDVDAAVMLINTPPERRQVMAEDLLGSLEKLDDLGKALDGINLVLTRDEFAQVVDWNQVDRFVLKQIRSGDLAVRPWAGFSFMNSWLRVQRIYQRYDHNDRMEKLAERIHETMTETLEKQGISQLLPEPVRAMKEMRVELSEGFEQDPVSADWEWVDPMGDCSYRVEKGKYLETEVPPDHDLWYRTNCDAPRLLRRISGDFTVETMISDGPNGKKSGGFLIWKDKDNLITFEVTYTLHYWAYIDQSRIGSCLYPLETDSCRLRLERQGDRFTAYVSWEGEEWYRCGWVDMPMDDPIQVGLHALCPEAPTTSTRFDYFRIYRAV